MQMSKKIFLTFFLLFLTVFGSACQSSNPLGASSLDKVKIKGFNLTNSSSLYVYGTFYGSYTTQSSGIIKATFSWGDGHSEEYWGPPVDPTMGSTWSFDNLNHTYSAKGTYTVNATVTIPSPYGSVSDTTKTDVVVDR
jgi:hypothetical protein